MQRASSPFETSTQAKCKPLLYKTSRVFQKYFSHLYSNAFVYCIKHTATQACAGPGTRLAAGLISCYGSNTCEREREESAVNVVYSDLFIFLLE